MHYVADGFNSTCSSKNRIADPLVNGVYQIAVVGLGTFWVICYGIWNNEYPSSSTDRRENMWMWFNKNGSVIDLENFDRLDENNKTKGKVLYTANFELNPHFLQFNRLPNHFHGPMRMMGPISSGYDSESDDFYLNKVGHRQYQSGYNNGSWDANHHNYDAGPLIQNEGELITKWSLQTGASIRDGNLGRAAGFCGQDPVHLEVFSKGTVVTTYFKRTERIEIIDRDQEGKEIGRRCEFRTSMEKKENEFVDKVEFRLSFRGRIWGAWSVNGDTFTGSDETVVTDTPFFTATIEGGWFKPTVTRITTKPTMDPALAMLIAHLCTTEYSIKSIKGHLQANTPPATSPPHPQYGGSFSPEMMVYNSPYQVSSESYVWHV